MGSVGCMPDDYVHSDIGRVRVESSRPLQESLGCRHRMFSGVGNSIYANCEMGDYCRMCSTLQLILHG